MGISNLKCDRCGKKSNMLRMSFFNEEECCENCLLIEQLHDEYKAAKQKEHEECLKGNYNYEGVGLPNNYNNWRKCFEDNFNFKAIITPGEHSNDNCCYYIKNKDLGSYLCLNDFKIHNCKPDIIEVQIKEIKSLVELKDFIISKELDYNEDSIKKFIISNSKQKSNTI